MLGAEDTILAFFISVDYASNRNRAGGACVTFTTHLTLKYALRLGSNAMLQFALKTIRLEREVYAHTAGPVSGLPRCVKTMWVGERIDGEGERVAPIGFYRSLCDNC
jgi:hypothetical protein